MPLILGEWRSTVSTDAPPLTSSISSNWGFLRIFTRYFGFKWGENGQKAEEIDSVAQQYGEMLERQSDRNFPKCRFSEGIRGGKLTASEFTGVLVCMLLVLKSGKDRNCSVIEAPFGVKKLSCKTGLCCWRPFFNGKLGSNHPQ